MKELIVKKVVRLDIPEHLKIHHVVYVSHTISFFEQLSDFGQSFQTRSVPIRTLKRKEHIIDKMRNHRKRGRGCKFPTLMKVEPHHDEKLQTKSDFADKDGTLSDTWLEYIGNHDILQIFHE